MAARNPFEDDVPELTDAEAERMAQAAVDEGCPADFLPAQAARPAKQAPRRRSPEKTPKPQQEAAENSSPPMRLVPLAEIAKQDAEEEAPAVEDAPAEETAEDAPAEEAAEEAPAEDSAE